MNPQKTTASTIAEGEPDAYRGMIVVIPTRNRSDFVKNALRSLAAQSCKDRLHVFLSDNSTEPEEIERNRQTAASTCGLRITYLRPPNPMPMTEHWEWAAKQALTSGQENHVLFLTDRMLLKPGGLDRVEAVARVDVGRIISFQHERIDDYIEPVVYERCIASGECLVIPAPRLLALAARMMFHPSMPRMLNCLVPRALMLTLKERHGKFFDSISPDFNFCFRAMAVVDCFVFIDDPILVHYGISRSNGAGVSRGVHSRDTKDFISNLPASRGFFPCAPIPGLATVANAIAHEYNAVRAETGFQSFPMLDIDAYLAANEKEVRGFVDPRAREDALLLLASHPSLRGVRISLFRVLVARAKTWIYRTLTRKCSLIFPSTWHAIDHLFRLHKGVSFLDRLRIVPYRFFLRRLMHCTAWAKPARPSTHHRISSS